MKFSLAWLCVCICLSRSQNDLILKFSALDKDKNNLTYQCSPGQSGPSTIDSTSCYFVFTNRSERRINGTVQDGRLELNIEVNPMNESEVICKCEGSANRAFRSNSLSVAATQSYERRIIKYVIREDESVPVVLECPYVLGNLHMVLQSYHVCWHTTTCQPSTCCRQNSDISLSPDNRTLTTNITRPATNHTFSCALILTRCENCNPEPPEFVEFEIQVFDLLNIVSPSNGTTQHHNGGNISLSCLANGTNITSKWIVDGNMSNSDITDISVEKQLNSTLTLNLDDFTGRERISIMCAFDQTFPNGSIMSMNRILILLSPETETTEASSGYATKLSTFMPATGNFSLIIGVSAVAVITITCGILIFLFFCICCYFRRNTKKNHYTVETPSNLVLRPRPKRPPIYEELPGPILGTEPQLMRQCGIDYDPTHCRNENGSYQGSDEPLCGGSDVSGLSGVSGNIPGAHQMPRYNTEDSILSDNFLVPPQPWSRNVSNSTFNTATTQSTVLGSSSCSDDLSHNTNSRLYSSEVHYPRPPCALPERRYSYSEHPSRRISDCVHHCPSCHSSGQQIPFNNTPIVQSVGSSSSSLHKPAMSTSSSRSNSVSNSPYHHSKNASPYHRSMNPSPYHHSMNPSPCHHHSAHSSPSHHTDGKDSIPEFADYLLKKVKHNRNCKIPGCLCKSLKELNTFEDNDINKVHGTKRRKPSSTVTSSSTESESDTPDHKSRKKTMHLELKKDSEEELYPHYHLSTKSHAIHSSQRKSNSSKRRSRSLTDLTPITETRETPTPNVGGAVLAGTPVYPPKSLGDDGQIGEHYIAPSKQALLTPGPAVSLTKPRPQLLRQTSISIDNLPVLCLNDCVAKLTTPSPTKQSIYLTNKVSRNGSILKTVQETVNNSESEVSNTSSRSKSPPEAEAVKSSQSDNEDTEFCTHDPSLSRYGSFGYDSSGGETSSLRNSRKAELCSYGQVESSGYESGEGSMSRHKAKKVTDRTSKSRNGLKSKAPQPLPIDPVEPNHVDSGIALHYSNKSPKDNLTTPSFRTHNSPIPSRSPSPFETETKVREDGTKIQTTEC